MMTLWSIPSNATTRLMVQFYKHYRTGVDPSEALRRAKLKMRTAKKPEVIESQMEDRQTKGTANHSGNGSHPFYWAAFVLTGT